MSAGLRCHSSRIPRTAKLTTLRFMPLPMKPRPASVVIQAWNGRKPVFRPPARAVRSDTTGRLPRAPPAEGRGCERIVAATSASRQTFGAHKLLDGPQVVVYHERRMGEITVTLKDSRKLAADPAVVPRLVGVA